MRRTSPFSLASFMRPSIFVMLSYMIGSNMRMLDVGKKPLMVLRRLPCMSWSIVATMEF